MELTGLFIDGFGVWNDLEYLDFSHQITAVYGRNEAGKTTLMQFIRSILYGYSSDRRQRYLPPHHGGRPGGWLQIDRPDGSVRLERYADGDRSSGQLAVYDNHGALPVEPVLQTLLGDVDEATFNNVYAIGLREMQELGTLSDTDAARWLYSLTTGLDRISLLDVVRALDSSREQLLSSSGHPSQITELLSRRAHLQGEIDQCVIQNRRWSQITIKLQELSAEIEKLEVERGRLEYRARTIEIAVQVKPKWLQRIDLDRQLAPYHGRIRLPDDALQNLEQLNLEIESHERQQEVLKCQRHALREEVEALGINETLVRSTARIEALGEQRDWLEALERQQSVLHDELQTIQSQLASEHDRLGFDLQTIDLDKKKIPDLSEGLVNSLRPHAKAVRGAREQLATAEREAESKCTAVEEYQAQIIAAMPESAASALPTDLEAAGELVANLRKRLHIDERLEQAQRHEVELQQQNHELLDRQEAPLWTAAALAILLFTGLAFLAYGLLAASSTAQVFGGAALVCFFGWHLLKYLTEDQLSQRREECQRQLSLARTQIDAAKEEKRALDEHLGPVQGSVVVQLQSAERHLHELEKLLPIETRRREAKLEADAAARKCSEAERVLKSALASWRNKLKGLGLPQDLTPSDIRALASRFEQVTDLRLRVERRRNDAEQRCREHAALCKRIRNLAEEVQLLLPEATPIEQLDHLESHVRQHRMRVDERDRLRQRAKELKESESRHTRAATALRHRRESMFVQAGTTDEAAYRILYRDQQQADRLRNELTTVCREITAAIGNHAPEPEIIDLLGPESIGFLDNWWEIAVAELENIEQRLKDTVASRGALQQELDQLSTDRSLAERQLELAAVEEQLQRATTQWRARTATCIVLKEVQIRYERERQPETLIAASEHMKRLTGGAYHRIWTPLGKEILFVDNAKGESLAVEALSRGTREQLFLSLRLALVALLARRGIRLPMILDDVLVNFDENRIRQAVHLLKEFADQGHQILVFTCHEFIYQMFRNLNLNTWRLPDHEGTIIAETPFSQEILGNEIPAIAAVDHSYEYLTDLAGSSDIIEPVEEVAAMDVPIPKPVPKPKAKTKRIPRRKPENVLPPPLVKEVVAEPARDLAEEPLDNDDEWIRIGPQVRPPDRMDRRTIRESDLYEVEYNPPLTQHGADPVFAEHATLYSIEVPAGEFGLETDPDRFSNMPEDDEYEDGEYEDGEYEDGEYEDGEYEDDEYEDDEYEDDEYEDDEYEDDEYEDDEYEDDEYEDGEYEDDEYEDDEYEDGEYEDGEYEDGEDEDDEDIGDEGRDEENVDTDEEDEDGSVAA